jgi:hypothetical protein
MKAIAIGILMVSFGTTARATVTKADFGKTPDGHIVEVYTLTSGPIGARVITFGAKLISVRAPDRNGRVADVVLGYDTLPEWLADRKTHFGAVVGRYGNRIAKGAFTLDGHTYQIPVNNNSSVLHGGTDGFLTAYALGDGGRPRSVVVINRDSAQPSPDNKTDVTFGGAAVAPDGRWKAKTEERIRDGSVTLPKMSAVVLRFH